MFPLIRTALHRDYKRGYYSPYEGLLVYGGTSQVESQGLGFVGLVGFRVLWGL